MSNNRDVEAAWKYHDATKHSYTSVRANAHTLDWSNLPRPFKVYPTLEVTRLPRETPEIGVAALSALASAKVSAKQAVKQNLFYLSP